MKKQLLLTLAMLFAGQVYAIINNVTDAQKELKNFQTLIKEGPVLHKKQGSFKEQWNNNIESCLLYSIASNIGFPGKDKALEIAAENTWKMSNTILNLYLTVEAEQRKIKADSAIERQILALIKEKKVALQQISRSINKTYLITSKKQNAKKVILAVIDALNAALKELEETIYFAI